MRDSNGTGNIYFDDLFVNGIPYYSILFYTINGSLSLIILLALPLFFYGSFINSGYHRNYRIVSINIYFAFFLFSGGNFVYSLLVLSRISDRDHDFIFSFFRFEAAFGTALWRAAFLSIALERTAATLFNKNYEKLGPLWLALTLILFALLLGVLIPLALFVFRIQFFIFDGIIAAIDFVVILAVALLLWSNKILRKLNMSTQIVLTQRYQITENLRILHIITPLIIVGTIFDFLAIIASGLQAKFDFTTQLYYPLYYGINNLYVSIALILLFKYNIKARRRIVLLLFKRCQSTIVPESVNLTNVDGKQLVINETPDIHFNHLTSFWK